MQTRCWEMPWVRVLRVVALMLTVVLGLEWTVPLGGYAEPNQESASPPPPSVGNQESPPMPEAESAEAQSPLYKKAWFWVLVVVGLAVGVLVAALATAASEGGLAAGGPPAP